MLFRPPFPLFFFCSMTGYIQKNTSGAGIHCKNQGQSFDFTLVPIDSSTSIFLDKAHAVINHLSFHFSFPSMTSYHPQNRPQYHSQYSGLYIKSTQYHDSSLSPSWLDYSCNVIGCFYYPSKPQGTLFLLPEN